MSGEPTKRERECLEHLRSAEGLDVSLKEYADSFGVDVNFLYNVKSRLMRKGVLARARRKPAAGDGVEDSPARAPSPFVAVRVEETAAPVAKPSPVLRLKHRRGHVLEFAQWPPVALLTALLGEACDAACGLTAAFRRFICVARPSTCAAGSTGWPRSCRACWDTVQ